MPRANLRNSGFVACLFVLTLVLTACGGGGGSSSTPAPPTASLQSSLQDYNFGYVTLFNTPAAKTLSFTNSGNAPLQIYDIQLTSGPEFSLDLGSAAGDCQTGSPALAGGASCNVRVTFTPTAQQNYSGTLTVTSDDPVTPTLVVQLYGNGQPSADPVVRINQVEPDACDSTSLKVYVSVTDQLGYPITGLGANNFTLTQLTTPQPVQTSDYVQNVTAPISVALVLDYSSSITSDPSVVAAMESGVSHFINQLGASDEAEIIKFATQINPAQSFTSDKTALLDALTTPWDGGIYSQVYDALNLAVEDISTRSNERRAVILLSDGVDKHAAGDSSTNTLTDVINRAAALGVPVFTVGIGAELDRSILGSISNNTGGQLFDVVSSGTLVTDSLKTIYQQQAQILFVDQYILTYDTIFTSGVSATLTVEVTTPDGLYGYDTRSILPCP